MTAVPVLLVEGVLAASYGVAGLFFLKFWARTRDRLFAMFAASFWLLALQRALAVLTWNWYTDATWLFVLRLIAFAVLLVAMIDKNRAARRPDVAIRPDDG